MNIFKDLKAQVINALTSTFGEHEVFSKLSVEIPKDRTHGDFATNAAMVVSKPLCKNPREVAEALKSELLKTNQFEAIEIAGPGFINFRLKNKILTNYLFRILEAERSFGQSKELSGKKVDIEFVSANPTGPLHIGHARGAVVGDAIANIMKACGAEVAREYYINDAGVQIQTLVKSFEVRFRQLLGQNIELGADMYPGEYLLDAAKIALEKFGADFIANHEQVESYVVGTMMDSIRSNLAEIGVNHEIFTSEKHDIRAKGYIEKAIDQLRSKGLIYEGVLEAPKGIKVEDWEAKEQLIFKSTEFGDDIDRVVKKSDGSYTYFAADLGLAIHKLERGYDDLVLLLGADHSGYVKRIEAIFESLSRKKDIIDIKLNQMVNLFKNGEPFRMSKRAGNFVLISDVVEEVGKDILRFVMLSRKNDTIFDFDFAKVKEQSKENPVFYVQYAHARACSILRKIEELGINNLNDADLSLIKFEHERDLIKEMLNFPRILISAAETHEPHKVAYYIIELANLFHSMWSKNIDGEDLRFIIPDNIELTKARCSLVKAAQITIKNALNVLGIEAMETM